MRGGLRTYCVDGTNVVRGCYGYGGPEFREQEDADCLRLIAALGQVCESLGSRIEIDVFFDGGYKPWAGAAAANLSVRFAQEIQADDLILDRVRLLRRGGDSVTVVTADAELGRRVAEEGGGWLKVRPGAKLEAILGSIERRFLR